MPGERQGAEPDPASSPPAGEPPQPSDALETYQTVAETVGGVPSLRLRDNLIQGIVVLIGTVAGAIVGYALLAGGETMGGMEAALLGAGAGLIASALLSGVVLMILGWVRAAAKLPGSRPPRKS